MLLCVSVTSPMRSRKSSSAPNSALNPAETMLRLAETQIEQMLAAAAEAAKEIETLRSQLAAKVTAIQTIVDAIRTQLPTTLTVPTEEAADVSSTAKRSPFLRIHSGRT